MAKYDLYGNLMEDEMESDMLGLGKISNYLGNQSLGDLTKFGGLTLGAYDQLFGTGGKAATAGQRVSMPPAGLFPP